MSNFSNNLEREWSKAQGQWEKKDGNWRDDKAIKFEREYWATFEQETPSFIKVLHELERAIQESQRRIPE